MPRAPQSAEKTGRFSLRTSYSGTARLTLSTVSGLTKFRDMVDSDMCLLADLVYYYTGSR